MSSTALVPCPGCGCKAELVETASGLHRVICTRCGASGNSFQFCQEAVARWNKGVNPKRKG